MWASAASRATVAVARGGVASSSGAAGPSRAVSTPTRARGRAIRARRFGVGDDDAAGSLFKAQHVDDRTRGATRRGGARRRWRRSRARAEDLDEASATEDRAEDASRGGEDEDARDDPAADDVASSNGTFPAEPEEEWTLEFPSSVDDAREKWDTIPSRYRIIVGTTCAFILCNMDKVNISVAIIPMASEMGWSASTAGFLQSAFFYGFALSQLPGGYLATRFGGARMLPIGVAIWSAATFIVPFVADNTAGLFASRVLVGLGEGISPAAATDVIARSVPLSERSRAVAFTFNGFSIGSVLGLSLAPAIITNFGWRSVFFLFGGVGLGWVAWVGNGVYKRGGASPDADPKTLVGGRAPVKGLLGKRVMLPEKCEVDGSVRFSSDDCDVDVVSASGSGSFDDDGVRVFMMDEEDPEEDFLEEEPEPPVPWGEIFSCVPVRALAYVHFCNNWGFYVLLAWLPSYFTQEIGVNLTNASLFTLLPPLANIVVASFVGPLADAAIERATPVNVVRKTAQSVAFFGPATFMGLACFDYFDNPLVTVGLLTVGLSLSSFSYAGLYCNHQDMSPRYASILLGMTNTVGAFPGVIGVPLTGYLLERTDNWEVSMFAPAVFFYVTGAAVFAKWGSAEKQEWG